LARRERAAARADRARGRTRRARRLARTRRRARAARLELQARAAEFRESLLEMANARLEHQGVLRTALAARF